MASAKIPPGDFGKWVHIAGVFDGSSWSIFRNGELVASKPSATGSVRVRGNEWAIGAKVCVCLGVCLYVSHNVHHDMGM